MSNVTQCADEFCLFDMSNDAEECQDLSKQHPNILDKMLQRLSEYEATMVLARNIRFKDPWGSLKFQNGVFEPWAKEYWSNYPIILWISKKDISLFISL